MTVNDVTIEKLRESDIHLTSVLLSESMGTNPNHISIFGSPHPAAQKKQRKMFEMVLEDPRNTTFIAKLNHEIVGSMTYTTSDFCQISKPKIIQSLPKFINMFGRNLFSVLRWRANWATHDPAYKHVHFGPLAVHQSYQGKGIGKLLLTEFCHYLDDTGQVGYLETDKAENVSLYEKFGFKVTETDQVLGVKNWFMVRNAKITKHGF